MRDGMQKGMMKGGFSFKVIHPPGLPAAGLREALSNFPKLVSHSSLYTSPGGLLTPISRDAQLRSPGKSIALLRKTGFWAREILVGRRARGRTRVAEPQTGALAMLGAVARATWMWRMQVFYQVF